MAVTKRRAPKPGPHTPGQVTIQPVPGPTSPVLTSPTTPGTPGRVIGAPVPAPPTGGGFSNDLYNPVTGAPPPTSNVPVDGQPTGGTQGGVISGAINQRNPLANIRGVEAATIELDPDTQTVEGRVQNIIQGDDEILRMEATRARQAQAASGRLNTTMAQQAEALARYQTAIPIASEDAKNILTSLLGNQQATNLANNLTATELNAAAMQALAGNQQIEAIGATGAETRLTNEQLSEIERRRDSALFKYDQSITRLEGQLKLDLEDIKGRYANQLQTSTAAMTIFSNSAQAISAILANPDIETFAKNSLVAQQAALLNDALAVLTATSGIDVTALLNFSDTGGGGTGGGGGTVGGTPGSVDLITNPITIPGTGGGGSLLGDNPPTIGGPVSGPINTDLQNPHPDDTIANLIQGLTTSRLQAALNALNINTNPENLSHNQQQQVWDWVWEELRAGLGNIGELGSIGGIGGR